MNHFRRELVAKLRAQLVMIDTCDERVIMTFPLAALPAKWRKAVHFPHVRMDRFGQTSETKCVAHDLLSKTQPRLAMPSRATPSLAMPGLAVPYLGTS